MGTFRMKLEAGSTASCSAYHDSVNDGFCPYIAKKDQRGSEQDDNFCTRGLKKKQALNTIAGEWGFNRVGRQDCENSYVPHEVGAKGLGYYECVYNATGEEKCKPFRPVLMCVRFFSVFLIVWVTWNLLGAAVGFQRDEST